MLHNFRVSNYKSLKNVELTDIPALAVIVGPNASGKSNLLDSIDFLATVFRTGLDDALSIRGGYENIASRRTRRARAPIKFEISVESPKPAANRRRTRWDIEGNRWSYTLEFKARGSSIDADVQIVSEHLAVSEGKYGPYETVFTRDKAGALVEVADEVSWLLLQGEASDAALIRFPQSEAVITRLPHPQVRSFRSQIAPFRTYQISPLMARRPSAPTADSGVGRFGQNIASALRRLSRDPERMERLMNHVRVAVPSMVSVEADYLATKELGLFFKEEGFNRRWFADDVSDGTIQTVALFLALLGNETGVLVEEPETSLHPWILRHFMELAKDVSSPERPRTQVFMTTHSPIAVNALELENLFITERIDGETQVLPAADYVDDAGTFREFINQQVLGLGEIWDRGILGGVP